MANCFNYVKFKTQAGVLYENARHSKCFIFDKARNAIIF